MIGRGVPQSVFPLTRRRVMGIAAGVSGLLLKPLSAAETAACRVPVPAPKIFRDGLNFPENPRWRDGSLWFADIHAHKVLRATPPGEVTEVASFNDRVSGLGFLPDGTLLVVSLLDRKILAVAGDGAVRVHADVSHLSRNFINDMVVDGQGRAYIGSRNGGTPASASDSLLLVTPDGQTRVAADNMISPNGSVVTADGRHLIVAETAVGRLTRFRIGADGTLTGRETIARIEGHHIDGLCMDDSGAFWGGGAAEGLLRISADGQLLRVVPFPGRMVIACVIGGAHRRTLYVTTTSPHLLDNLARIGNDRSLDATVNSDGRIETVALDGLDC
jgi:sugar lactone lactonase YvrE